jgi:hypothetical protein
LVSIIDLATIVSAAAGLLLAVFAVIQLRHMEKHRNVDVSMRLFEWAENERLRRAFRWVEEEFRFDDYEQYMAEVKSDFEVSDYPYEVTGFFEQVGFLVEKHFVDLDVIDDRLGTYVISNWKKLEPWIMALRKEKGDRTFGEHFQRLYEKTIKYLRKR